MFLLGCELDQRLLSKQWKRSAPIALSAIAFPFGVGCAASLWLEVGWRRWGHGCGGMGLWASMHMVASLLLYLRKGWGQQAGWLLAMCAELAVQHNPGEGAYVCINFCTPLCCFAPCSKSTWKAARRTGPLPASGHSSCSWGLPCPSQPSLCWPHCSAAQGCCRHPSAYRWVFSSDTPVGSPGHSPSAAWGPLRLCTLRPCMQGWSCACHC